jgi:hypothetical protein
MIAAENAASGPLSDAEARRIFRACPPLYGPHMGMIPKQKRFKMYSCHRPTAAGTR